MVENANILFVLFLQDSRVLTVSDEKRKLPEVKVLIIICYFLGASLLALVAYALSFWFGPVNEGLADYILCQSMGIQSGKSCDTSELNGIVRLQAMYDTVAFLFTLIPTVNLLYAFNPRKIKQYCAARLKDSDKAKTYTTYTVDF